MTDTNELPPPTLPALAERAAAEVVTLDAELVEIESLLGQARTEAARHETRRTQAAEKLAGLGEQGAPGDALEAANQLVATTKRAAFMEQQVEVLAGKQRVLARYREALAGYAASLDSLAHGLGPGAGPDGPDGSPAVSRVILSAQEDLRREIARAMHDGPAQSLTNIVLQAQIVDRLVGRDDAQAKAELQLLVEMVQQTLDATKSFIFDVRPMVLDDLGLVATLRRAALERSRRARIPVSFDSDGQDRRLPVDLESALFRMADEALAGFLDGAPDSVSLTTVWDAELAIEVAAAKEVPEPEEPEEAPAPDDMLPVLREMIEERRERDRPKPAEPVRLPDATWRDLEGRAATLGLTVERLDDGSRLRVVVPLPDAS